MTLNLRKFNMQEIDDDKVVVMVGKRETGKSFLTRDLLYHHRDVPVGIAISGTEGANSFYSSIMPKLFIHEEYDTAIVTNLLKRQKKLAKVAAKTESEGKTCNIDRRAFIVLDDCLYDQTWQRDKRIRQLFMNGRHYSTLLVITMQFALGIPPNLRTNIDYVFLLRENIVSNRKRLYEHYAGMFPTFDIFQTCMDQCTEDFGCLVIHNNAKSNKIEDQVFWYKAEPHPDFKIGPPSVWKYSDENCLDSSSDEEGFNTNNYRKNKQKVIIKKM